MKVIALVPVRNEAWVLRHTLAALSAFCDVILVNDQNSDDRSVALCAEFPKAVVLDTIDAARLPQRARWRLLDAARDYDGHNLLWCTDADELPVPSAAREFVGRGGDLARGTVIDARVYNAWHSMTRYRSDWSLYGPKMRPLAFVDDRITDYPRDPNRPPLHEPRVPGEGTNPTIQVELPVIHLQWAIWNRNQMKQAWYRCIEWMDGRRSAADINDQYSITLPKLGIATTPVPAEWLAEMTLPPESSDDEPSWHEPEILRWFDERGAAFFEPLEIWHIGRLRAEFRRRVGRAPRPDRSYRPAWPLRAQAVVRRVYHGVRRRILP